MYPQMAYYGGQMYMPPGYPQGMYGYMPPPGMPGIPGMPGQSLSGAPVPQPDALQRVDTQPRAQEAQGTATPEAEKQAPQVPGTHPAAQTTAVAPTPQGPASQVPTPQGPAPHAPTPQALALQATPETPAVPPVPGAAPQQRELPRVPGAAPGHRAASKANVSSSEFDFESANAQFKKERNEGEARLDAIPPAASSDFYNKKSGFFDNISSEVKDRHEGGRGRAFAAEERAKNAQTFGEGAAASAEGNRRGGRRGGARRRGRGNNKPEWA